MIKTKKVVINSCYGGFGLSSIAVKRIAELQGKQCFFFDRDNNLLPIIENSEDFWQAFDTDNISQFNNSADYKNHILEESPRDREDPFLIQAVEELKEKANAKYAKLKIVEIPNDVKYTIDEYSGFESIHEIHRIWGN